MVKEEAIGLLLNYRSGLGLGLGLGSQGFWIRAGVGRSYINRGVQRVRVLRDCVEK